MEEKKVQAKLIQKLAAIQLAEGLSDRQFAEKLGLSNGLWSGVKANERVMGRKALRVITEAYPGLHADIEDYWMRRLTAVSVVGASHVSTASS